MFREVNPYVLALTFAVTLLHSVFDFLAFKNGMPCHLKTLFFFLFWSLLSAQLISALNLDISFWRNRKSVKGLSVRSFFVSIVFQSIVFLYLLDNETSTIILVSSGVSLVIDFWKINKVVVITVRRLPLPPRCRIDTQLPPSPF